MSASRVSERAHNDRIKLALNHWFQSLVARPYFCSARSDCGTNVCENSVNNGRLHTPGCSAGRRTFQVRLSHTSPHPMHEITKTSVATQSIAERLGIEPIKLAFPLCKRFRAKPRPHPDYRNRNKFRLSGTAVHSVHWPGSPVLLVWSARRRLQRAAV